MKVTELMRPDAYSSQPDAALRSAIQMMRARRCGALPVIDADHHVVGIVTDRDAALAIGAMTAAPYTCKAEDSVHRALDLMRRARVRRLPVVDSDDRLIGLLSIDDIVLVAQNVRAGIGRVSFEQAMSALEAICARSTGNRSPRVARREMSPTVTPTP
jgi:CBS domain-containing protein